MNGEWLFELSVYHCIHSTLVICNKTLGSFANSAYCRHRRRTPTSAPLALSAQKSDYNLES